MTCCDCETQMEVYHDGELDLAVSLALEEHLASCPACSCSYAARRLQSSRIRIEAPRHVAPASLRRRIERLLPEATPVKEKIPRHWGLPAAAAAIVLIGFSLCALQPGGEEAIASEVVTLHTRAMMHGRLTDVASSDQHTVKPWFGTRVNFAPPVKDYAAQGFELVGGRVDHLDERHVAALTYRQGAHLIGVFIWPLRSARDYAHEHAPAAMAQRGFNIVCFERDRMSYWLISDLNPDDLGRLAQLLYEQK